jgi:hypothetical protein
LGKFILAIPAGKEMKVLIIGKRREIKIAQSPCLAKNLSAVDRSLLEIKTYFPYRKIKARPPQIPTQYAATEPTTHPKAPATETKYKLNLPAKAKYPEKGIMTSEGKGIQADSIPIARTIPQYPPEEIIQMIHLPTGSKIDSNIFFYLSFITLIFLIR